MKIVTSKKNRKGLSVQLMSGVVVLFDKDCIGILEDDSKFDELVKRDLSISKFIEETTSNSELVEVTESIESNDKQEELTEVVDSSIDIDILKVEELQEICRASNLDEREWKTLKKSQLISYIRENI